MSMHALSAKECLSLWSVWRIYRTFRNNVLIVMTILILWTWEIRGVIFTARAHARAVLGVVILSVRPSVTRVDCDKTKWRTADIFIPHERAITLLLWYEEWLVGDAPFPLKSALRVIHLAFEKRRLRPISAHNVSTVRDSEKSSITTNIKSTTGFPTSHRWSAYVTPKYSKGWLKERFFRFLSVSQRLIVSSAVNFVRRSVL